MACPPLGVAVHCLTAAGHGGLGAGTASCPIPPTPKPCCHRAIGVQRLSGRQGSQGGTERLSGCIWLYLGRRWPLIWREQQVPSLYGVSGDPSPVFYTGGTRRAAAQVRVRVGPGLLRGWPFVQLLGACRPPQEHPCSSFFSLVFFVFFLFFTNHGLRLFFLHFPMVRLSVVVTGSLFVARSPCTQPSLSSLSPPLPQWWLLLSPCGGLLESRLPDPFSRGCDRLGRTLGRPLPPAGVGVTRVSLTPTALPWFLLLVPDPGSVPRGSWMSPAGRAWP